MDQEKTNNQLPEEEAVSDKTPNESQSTIQIQSQPIQQSSSTQPEVHNSSQKSIGQFILGDRLGEGTFGTVRLATHIETNEQVAIKILEKVKILQLEDKTRVEREIKILKCLRHNNITQLYSVIQTNDNICLVIEYVKGKELFDYIITNRHLSEAESCSFYQQIISGVEYLHKLKVAHRDLKPENLLIDEKNTIKIVDFGLSIVYGEDEMLSTACGSPCYAAPEMLTGKPYKATGVDIWSSGIVLYAMLCGYLPFDDTDNELLYRKITQGKYEMPSNISDAAKDLLRRILTTDPTNRISIYQIKRHPWFNNSNPKLTMSLGLLINQNVIPIDEELIEKMAVSGIIKEEIRANLLSNRHNHITTTYYLLLRKKIKENKTSVADLKSEKFLMFINNKQNLFSKYENDFKNVVSARAILPDYDAAKMNTDYNNSRSIMRNKNYMNKTVSAGNKEIKIKEKGCPADYKHVNTFTSPNHYNKLDEKLDQKSNFSTGKSRKTYYDAIIETKEKEEPQMYSSYHNKYHAVNYNYNERQSKVSVTSNDHNSSQTPNFSHPFKSKNKLAYSIDTKMNCSSGSKTNSQHKKFETLINIKKTQNINFTSTTASKDEKCKDKDRKNRREYRDQRNNYIITASCYENLCNTYKKRHKKAISMLPYTFNLHNKVNTSAFNENNNNFAISSSTVFNATNKSNRKSIEKVQAAPYRQDLPIASCPFDLSCIIIMPLAQIKDKAIAILQNKKIKFRSPKQSKFLCEINHMQFSLDFAKRNDIVNAYIIRLKRIEGSSETYQSATAYLIEKLSLSS